MKLIEQAALWLIIVAMLVGPKPVIVPLVAIFVIPALLNTYLDARRERRDRVLM